VLLGEPGVGKTALLRYAEEQAEGMTVLQARGLEEEAELAFSGLADLFRPLVDQLETIPPPQAAALAGALGLGPAVAGDRFVVCAATLSLLATGADARPVLAIVDDSQWLDEASSEALLFASRRLEAERVALLMASREPEPAAHAFVGLDELTLSGLDRRAASGLLSDCVPHAIAPQVIDRLMQVTGGNPLALRELAANLSETQLIGSAELGEPLPPAAGVERAFLRRVERLGPETRKALLVVAASSGVTSTIAAACELLGFPPTCLEPAEENGLIRSDDGRTHFSHPLLRAAVYHSATISARARAHTALAEGLTVDVEPESAGAHERVSLPAAERRAWHLAAAARGPDESVAAALENAAASARGRGGYAASATALDRAARLSPADKDRARRLVGAARDWLFAGHAGPALALLHDALASTEDERQRAAIQHLRAQVEMSQGEFVIAYELLESEAARIAAVDQAQTSIMLADAAMSASACGQIETAVRLSREAHALGTQAGGTAELAGDMIFGGLLVAAGEGKQGTPLVLRHAQLPEGEDPPPVVLQFMPTVLLVLEEYDKARALLDWLTASARNLSAPSLLVPALPLRADLGYRTGDWLAAYADAVEGLRLARETNGNVLHALAYLAQIEAARGLERECRGHSAELLSVGGRFGVGAALSYAHTFLGRLALGLGLIDEAIAELQTASSLMERHGVREPNWVQEAPDLIEAYVRAGRHTEATERLSDLQRKAERAERVWALAAAARCRGLLADDVVFEREFEEALAYHDRTPTPFERARTELCFGERLRRARRPSDARLHLRSALEMFDRLDAAPWTARARSELEASGENVRPRGDGGLRSLTPQELQLALIVGRGATNKEASAAFFVSPKTVEAHLHHIYVKLSIRSRTELARILALEQMLD
jgi:DNA-binding CsgD family transcriptional regulator/tetratricopeptide (TPR) repeat protein